MCPVVSYMRDRSVTYLIVLSVTWWKRETPQKQATA